MCLAASIIGCCFRELVGCLTFGGAPGSNVDDSLDGAYLGPFRCSQLATKINCFIMNGCSIYLDDNDKIMY